MVPTVVKNAPGGMFWKIVLSSQRSQLSASTAALGHTRPVAAPKKKYTTTPNAMYSSPIATCVETSVRR